MNDAIIDFYRGEGTNAAGDMLDDILTWSNGALEMDHNYIQWMFPSNEPSGINCDAPVLDQETAELFKADPELEFMLQASFLRILDFFGFVWDFDTRTVIPMQPTESRPHPRLCLEFFNHNMLRVTRVIKSLRLCGLEQEALSFFEALKVFKNENSVSLNSWNYWEKAAEGPLWEDAKLVAHGQCIKCGGTMIGDGYTSVYRCEYVEDVEGLAPDEGPIYCNFQDD